MRHLYFYIFAALVGLSSCRARFYTPNRNPTPLFKEKGDIYVDASTNLINKGDITVGAAVSDNIGAYIGYAGAGQSAGGDTLGNDKYVYKGNMINIGAGYFLNQSQSNGLRFEIYADYAKGRFNNKITNTNKFFNGDFQRIGIMPNIGYRSDNDLFSICYSVRLSQIRFYNADVNPINYWSTDIDRYNHQTNYRLLEHGLNMRFGTENFKFQLQTGFYNSIKGDDFGAVPVFNFALMIGVVYEMNVKN